MHRRVDKLARCGLLAAFAIILSYVEFLLPLNLAIPGFKLGLANVVVVFAVFDVGIIPAALINLTRILIVNLLFSSPSSLIYALSGALLSMLVLILSKWILSRQMSFIGICVLSAAAHNVGQIAAAFLMLSNAAIFSYLPWLLLLSVPTGILTGLLLNLTYERLSRNYEKQKN